MTAFEYCALVPFYGYGLWLLIFPQSAITFYNWLGGRRARNPRTMTVRVLGFVVIAMMLYFNITSAYGRRQGGHSQPKAPAQPQTSNGPL